MENKYAIELDVGNGIDSDNKPDFDRVNRIGSLELDLPEKSQKELQEALDAKDLDKVIMALEQSGHTYSVLRQGETTKIFIQDKELEQIRAINFDERDDVERSEEILPELSPEERQEFAKRIKENNKSKNSERGEYGEQVEDKDFDEDIDRSNLDYKDEVRMNQMLFEAQDIYAINDVLMVYGLEPVPGDRPYIVEYQSGYESGMKVVFGQQSRVINEIMTEEEKQVILSCNDIGEVDNVIKHSGIDRADKRNVEMTNDEDWRRNREGEERAATGRNSWEYEGFDR